MCFLVIRGAVEIVWGPEKREINEAYLLMEILVAIAILGAMVSEGVYLRLSAQ
jgi:hypothetical protein